MLLLLPRRSLAVGGAKEEGKWIAGFAYVVVIPVMRVSHRLVGVIKALALA